MFAPLKRIKSLYSLVVIALLCAVSTSQSQDESLPEWHDDYQSGVEQARKEGKDLLLVFTATSWIEICEEFYKEILRQPDFMQPVSEKFVLIKLEYPKDGKLQKEEAFQKSLLRDAYRVNGFPTVVFTDAEGRPFGMNGYMPVTPAEYAEVALAIKDSHKKTLESREAAGNLSGIERAKKLIESVPHLPGNFAARYYKEILEEVVELDPENTLGHTEKFRKLLADAEYATKMQVLAKDVQWQKMIDLSDQYIEDFGLEGTEKQKVLMNKAGVQKQQNNAVGMIQTLVEIVKIDETSPLGLQAQQRLDVLRAGRLEGELAR
ncbi:MAG: hypothetical protein CMO55_13985 [Verrucomicrobiales bacterium]|nr:hypothetical protein [Verrucomicrobiales bacterium]